MPKRFKKVTKNENRCRNLHTEMNHKVAPTRLEPTGMFPAYIIPDLDPMQKQLNRLEERAQRMERMDARHRWKRHSSR